MRGSYAKPPATQEDAGAARRENFIRHIAMLTGSKIGDRLIDPKIVLSWLLGALAAPGWMIGLLVPIREAGSLLPQLFTARAVSRSPVRKGWWAAGALGQAASVFGMAMAAFFLEGAAAGWAILVLLTLFALSRNICSVSHKDVLGKTVEKGARGRVTGLSSSTAAIGALAFGIALATGILPKTVTAIAAMLVVAAALWTFASFISTRLEEPRSTVEDRDDTAGVLSQFRYLRDDPQLGRFIAVRGLLTVTALAPPYLLAATGESGFAFTALGPFVTASAIAALTSGYVWGRLSDLSSRRVLRIAATASSVLLGIAAILGWSGVGDIWLFAGLLYLMMIAYEGVRTGRSTHLIDMAPEHRRAAYTAVSNTVIGVILLIGGVFGLLADALGAGAALAVFAVLSALAALLAGGLEEVQR